MNRQRTIASAMLLTAALVPSTRGQAPPPSAAPARQVAPGPSRGPASLTRTQAMPRRRSIVHHYPYPYPGYYSDDRSGGWRNPGGLGRYREYYPPGAEYQMNANARDPVQVATFGTGGGLPTMADQREAHQIGIQKENSIQQHIDNYSRPYYGYGFGVGYFGGMN